MTADEIKSARIKLNLTQSELADRVGVTLRAVQYWEAGKRKVARPAVKVVEALLAERRARLPH
jgi:DNA-binding transcriptional regulator YiaG